MKTLAMLLLAIPASAHVEGPDKGLHHAVDMLPAISLIIGTVGLMLKRK